ncbi:MAG: family 65 glycosyl hydrolase, partial [Oscillospiraceae bacterium]|nr:family 65 glycosyl hydrolase [Oscillospiraceae bacterium]
MRAGTVLRCVKWRSQKKNTAILSFRRMASFTRPELFFTEITVESERPVKLEVVSELSCDVTNAANADDPRVASNKERYIKMREAKILGDIAFACCETSKSGLRVAAAMTHTVNTACEKHIEKTEAGIRTRIMLEITDKPVVISKLCAYSDSRRHEDCKTRAVAVLKTAIADGPEKLFSEQRAYLDDFWRDSGIAIHGDEKTSEGLSYNLYCLLQSAGRDTVSNITAKGLSGEGYEGHYFWDTEIYMLPFFLLTRPWHAKNLLEYRYMLLDAAREHAKILGHEKGALYAWRTITGSECSPYYPSGSAQYHINGDVAHSFMQYYYATKDIDFMAEKGAEVLVETARLWLGAGAYDRKGRLCYNGVTGPDEYTCMINNNYFTNVSAKNNLISAAYICGELERAGKFGALKERLNITDDELLSFQKAACDIYIPYDEELGINPQDDSFLDKQTVELSEIPKENFPILMHYHPLWMYRTQICKQPDVVLAHYLYGGADAETMKKSYEYYEKITTHDSSLSKCIFSIMASRLGLDEKAYSYFNGTVRTDLDNLQGNTRDGVHTANMGGAYLCVVAGFAGLKILQDGFHFAPRLPKTWEGYEFSFYCCGSLIGVSVGRDQSVFTLKSGKPVRIYVNGA